MEQLLSHDNNYRLGFKGKDIQIAETWSGFIVGRAEWQEDQWLLICYSERCADCMAQIEVAYVDSLNDVIRWINEGLPRTWDATQQ